MNSSKYLGYVISDINSLGLPYNDYKYISLDQVRLGLMKPYTLITGNMTDTDVCKQALGSHSCGTYIIYIFENDKLKSIYKVIVPEGYSPYIQSSFDRYYFDKLPREIKGKGYYFYDSSKKEVSPYFKLKYEYNPDKSSKFFAVVNQRVYERFHSGDIFILTNNSSSMVKTMTYENLKKENALFIGY